MSSPLPTTTPSITYNGFVVPTKEPAPRIAITLAEPGCPPPVEKFKPATRPFNTSSTEATGVCSKSSRLIVSKEPIFWVGSNLIEPKIFTAANSTVSVLLAA